jgi:hypothetical protein
MEIVTEVYFHTNGCTISRSEKPDGGYAVTGDPVC